MASHLRPTAVRGRSPWYLAWIRLRRNKVALAFGVLFLVIVAFCLAAPLWADHVAHTGPNQNHITDKILIDGQQTNIVSPDGTPLGPGLRGRYLLGADQNGRDVMVRLMYGGRTSIFVGVVAALITTVFAVMVGMLARLLPRLDRSMLSRVLEVVWAFPVLLLGIALGTTLALGGLKIGGLHVAGDSLWIPILIIGSSTCPTWPGRSVARSWRCGRRSSSKPLWPRAKAGAHHGVRIAAQRGVDHHRVLHPQHRQQHAAGVGAVLPWAGVRPPNASWGTMIADGYQNIYTAPHLTIVPGLMIVLTVLSLNVFGDGLRDALDPRAKIRLEH